MEIEIHQQYQSVYSNNSITQRDASPSGFLARDPQGFAAIFETSSSAGRFVPHRNIRVEANLQKICIERRRLIDAFRRSIGGEKPVVRPPVPKKPAGRKEMLMSITGKKSE